jgi:hypothetical protein
MCWFFGESCLSYGVLEDQAGKTAKGKKGRLQARYFVFLDFSLFNFTNSNFLKKDGARPVNLHS